MKYREYITNAGDRWDLLAYRFYKNPQQYELIIQANPDVEIVPILPSGLKLKIPVLEATQMLSGADVPPWKR